MDTLGPYQIVEELGRGAMGLVLRGFDPAIGRPVAIKIIRCAFASPDEDALLRLRFAREATAAGTLAHPNIVTIYHLGEHEGNPYLVMELIDGRPLSALLTGNRPLDPNQAIGILVQIAGALDFAHGRGVIHRDIKPANILIAADGNVKLTDFGIARIASQTLTATGMAMGTPAYMAPEQIMGAKIDGKADQFSLAVVAYIMLTGRHPFEAETAAGLMFKIAQEEPLSLSGCNPSMPGEAAEVIRRALSKRPGERYETCSEFASALHKALLPRQVTAPQELQSAARGETTAVLMPPAESEQRNRHSGSWPAKKHLFYRCREFIKRNRAASAVAVVGAVLIVAWFARTEHLARSGSAAASVRSVAVLPFENLAHDPQQEAFVDGMTDALIGRLGNIAALRVISRDSAMRYKGVDKPAATIARELNADVLVQGSVRRSGEQVSVSIQMIPGKMARPPWKQTYERAIGEILALQGEAARAIASEIHAPITPQEEARLSLGGAVNREAYEAYLKGRHFLYRHSVEGSKEALKHFREATDADPAYAMAWVGVADAYCALSDMYLPPHETMPKAKFAAQRALAIDGNLAEAHAALGLVQSQFEWDWAAAERSYQRAIALSPSYPWVHLNYSLYLIQLGRTEQAIEEATVANRLDPLLVLMETSLAYILYLARRPDEAIAHCTKILELEPNSTVTHLTLGWAYTQKAMYEKAAAEFVEARRLTSKQAYPDGIFQLAHVYAITGKAQEAKQLLVEMDQISHRTYVDPLSIAIVYAGLGEKDHAYQWLEKAYQDRDESLLLLKVDPAFDSLHSDPRFKNLLGRIGLPQ